MFSVDFFHKGLVWASLLLRRGKSHSTTLLDARRTMDVHVLSALSDNFMYLVVDKSTATAAVVDPVEPEKVLELVDSQKVKLTTVLTTHHHWDHAGGNKKLLAAVPGLRVLGGEDRVDAVNQVVKHGDKIELGDLKVECLFTPCHTRGHICYKVSSNDEVSLFTGDTLFIGGCGKFFEGNAEQMYNALVKIIGNESDSAKIYCGHEYTLSNLKFAKHVEPNNAEIDRKIEFAMKCRLEKTPTVPSTVGEEKLYNPFMRVDQPSVQKHVNQVGNSIQTMAALREEKNNFKA